MKEKILEFWNWFEANEKKFHELNPDNAPMLIEKVSKRLSRIHKDLSSHFSAYLDEEGNREYIISADGNQTLFPLVFDIIEHAPKLANWIFIPLKPRIKISEDMGVSQHGESIQVKDIYFQYEIKSEQKMDIILYIKKVKEVSMNLMESMYHLLDYIIGEYDVETKLAGIEIQPFYKATQPHLLHRLIFLPNAVDNLKTLH